MKRERSWASLMLVVVLRMLRYCRMSGTLISRIARRNRSPIQVRSRGSSIDIQYTHSRRVSVTSLQIFALESQSVWSIKLLNVRLLPR